MPAAAPVIKATFPFSSITFNSRKHLVRMRLWIHYARCGSIASGVGSGVGKAGGGARLPVPSRSKYARSHATLASTLIQGNYAPVSALSEYK